MCNLANIFSVMCSSLAFAPFSTVCKPAWRGSKGFGKGAPHNKVTNSNVLTFLILHDLEEETNKCIRALRAVTPMDLRWYSDKSNDDRLARGGGAARNSHAQSIAKLNSGYLYLQEVFHTWWFKRKYKCVGSHLEARNLVTTNVAGGSDAIMSDNSLSL